MHANIRSNRSERDPMRPTMPRSSLGPRNAGSGKSNCVLDSTCSPYPCDRHTVCASASQIPTPGNSETQNARRHRQRERHHLFPSKVHPVASLAIIFFILQLSTANAQECTCSPTQITWTLDFSKTCPPNDVDFGPDTGIARVGCDIGGGGGDSVPVIVESIKIFELGLDLTQIKVKFLEGEFQDGDTFDFTSIVATEPGNTPGGFTIELTGRNKGGETLVNDWILQYTNNCERVVFREGDSLGWTIFSDVPDPSTELCTTGSSGPDTPLPDREPSPGVDPGRPQPPPTPVRPQPPVVDPPSPPTPPTQRPPTPPTPPSPRPPPTQRPPSPTPSPPSTTTKSPPSMKSPPSDMESPSEPSKKTPQTKPSGPSTVSEPSSDSMPSGPSTPSEPSSDSMPPGPSTPSEPSSDSMPHGPSSPSGPSSDSKPSDSKSSKHHPTRTKSTTKSSKSDSSTSSKSKGTTYTSDSSEMSFDYRKEDYYFFL